VPLGVDLSSFHPGRFDESLRSELAPGDQRLVVHCSRLSPEKRPERAVGAVAELRRRGVRAVLVVAGDGPLRRPLQARAARLPVTFLGHVTDRGSLARLLATADVVIAPGPAETFGLSALEALASGTPVVVSKQSALPEVVGPGRPRRRGQRLGVRRRGRAAAAARRHRATAAGSPAGRTVRLADGRERVPRRAPADSAAAGRRGNARRPRGYVAGCRPAS
jgi:glycosyltransferase involved in cell wall biosynthesis